MSIDMTLPFKENDWEPAQVQVETLPSGEQRVQSPYPASASADNIIQKLSDASSQFANRVFLAQRGRSGDWDKLTYKQGDLLSDCVAQWLINQGFVAGDRAMILSENSLEHAIFMLGAMKARLVVVPVSPGYSLLSTDFVKLKNIYNQVRPSVIFVQDGGQYQKALNAVDLNGPPIVTVEGVSSEHKFIEFDTVVNTTAGIEVSDSVSQITPSTLAKILFTSGSTGEPKGVENTHLNMGYVHESLATLVHIDKINDPPIMLDWLPWHHTFGGNQNFNRTIHYAGTLYIDDGKPLPELFLKTLKSLKEIAVTTFSTVPAVYPFLLDALEKSEELRSTFFSKLNWFSYGGSDMPQSIFDRIQRISIAETGMRIPVITGMGSTESCAMITAIHWANEEMGNIGLPIPGTQLKLIPIGDKYEMRVKGPQVMPGYYNAPSITDSAFDEDGFFITGDAVRWIDPKEPAKGLKFAGRVTEDFKLLNGTWVHAGGVRSAVVSALSPLVSDAVVCGQDKEYLAVMVWLNDSGVRSLLSSKESQKSLKELSQSTDLAEALAERLKAYNAVNKGASSRIRRMLVLQKPPSLDANEITEKRYINQRAVLELRADDVNRLYASEPEGDIICV